MSEQTATAESARQKTVNDIWIEVQHEQAAFNRIIRWLVGLLIIAALIAAAAAAVSYFEFRGMQRSHQEAITNAQVLARLDSGEAARERQRMVTELIDIREAGVAARQSASLVRGVDRAAAAGEAELLIPDALAAAKRHAEGVRMNTATAHLVATVIDESRSGRIEIEGETLAFLEAVETDWTSPTGEAAEAFISVAEGPDNSLKPYANSALARLYYTNADNDNLSGDEKCNVAASYADRAIALGIDAIGPALWKGECLRKQGRSAEAYNAFADAHDWYIANQERADAALPIDHIRRVHHGVGTTLLALAARDEIAAVRGVDSIKAVLDQSQRHLEIAAALRVQRGEGRIGEVYTAENLGFIAVKREDWPVVIDHTAYVDNVLPLAWNLTARYIAARAIHDSLARGGEAATGQLNQAQAKEIACDAERVLAAMPYNYFDEPELRRLLPAKYSETIDMLIARPKDENARRQLELEGRAMHADAAFRTAGPQSYGSDLCR